MILFDDEKYVTDNKILTWPVGWSAKPTKSPPIRSLIYGLPLIPANLLQGTYLTTLQLLSNSSQKATADPVLSPLTPVSPTSRMHSCARCSFQTHTKKQPITCAHRRKNTKFKYSFQHFYHSNGMCVCDKNSFNVGGKQQSHQIEFNKKKKKRVKDVTQTTNLPLKYSNVHNSSKKYIEIAIN